MQKIVASLFAISLLLVGFGYGVVAVSAKIFPYSVLQEAAVAYVAWSDVLRQGENVPRSFERFAPGASPLPVAQVRAAEHLVDDGLILMTGGPYQLLERCPRFGCLAWLTNRDGEIVHTWEVDLDELWQDTSALSGPVSKLRLYPIGMQLFDNGDLVISFQGRGVFPWAVGIIKVDARGSILWKRMDYSHHWLTADDEGRIYTPALHVIDSPYAVGNTPLRLECAQGKIYEDVIRVLSPDGRPLKEISILDALAASDYAGFLYATSDPCDPTHLNFVQLVPAHLAGRFGGAEEGDLLVSLRNSSVIALLDQDSGAVKHAVAGRFVGQHSPNFLPDGRVLLFDNKGGDASAGGSRVVKLDLETGEIAQVFPPPGAADPPPIYTKHAGHIDISDDGRRALVSVTHQGILFEIDVETGEVLWEYTNTHDIGSFLKKNEIETGADVALFAAFGAYYAGWPSFLRKDQIAARAKESPS